MNLKELRLLLKLSKLLIDRIPNVRATALLYQQLKELNIGHSRIRDEPEPKAPGEGHGHRVVRWKEPKEGICPFHPLKKIRHNDLPMPALHYLKCRRTKMIDMRVCKLPPPLPTEKNPGITPSVSSPPSLICFGCSALSLPVSPGWSFRPL